ncbi:hypothetical protein LMG27198_45770 [Methylocystis echinoides]|uniref:Uncharacterized protein n=1 Tax=Methylocystis echinoides TaxID=29468 RepID=A0A9W6LU99_9HYPH|nr:hypothetical protein LMG27198_45770 [Methylocystis echinoides]
MVEIVHSQFASSNWWNENPQASLVVVHAILALSSASRSPEEIWSSPTPEEWLKVGTLAAEFDTEGDLEFDGVRMGWMIMSRVFRGDGAPPLLD